MKRLVTVALVGLLCLTLGSGPSYGAPAPPKPAKPQPAPPKPAKPQPAKPSDKNPPLGAPATFGPLLEKEKELIGQAVEQGKKIVDGAANKLKDLDTAGNRLATGVQKGVDGVAIPLKKDLDTAANRLATGVQKTADQLKKDLDTAGNRLATGVQKGVDGVAIPLKKDLDAAANKFATGVQKGVDGVAIPLKKDLDTAANRLATGVQKGVDGAANELKKTVSGAVDKAKKNLGGVVDKGQGQSQGQGKSKNQGKGQGQGNGQGPGKVKGPGQGQGGPSIRSRLNDAELPTTGRIRYVPPKDYKPTNPLPKGPHGGYLDRHDNEWVKGPPHLTGGRDPFEWDVQLPAKGGDPIFRRYSKDGKHVNVTIDGEIKYPGPPNVR
jgi:filamentous hemagglutinin